MPSSEFDPTEQCYGRDCERIMLRSRMTWEHGAWWCPECIRRIRRTIAGVDEVTEAARRAMEGDGDE